MLFGRSLVIRIGRLRLFAVLAAIPSLLVPANAAGGVLFQSNWDTATGTSNTAFTDNSLWTGYVQFDTSTPTMAVVSGGPNGHNALRATQNGPVFGTDVWKANFAPAGTDYFVRFYFRSDDTSGAGDHVVTAGTLVGGAAIESLTYVRKYGSSSGFFMALSNYACGNTIWQTWHWGPANRLALGRWYRFEYWIEWVNATHVRVHPRVYDDGGTLLYDDATFVNGEPQDRPAIWNGQAWTLASYYAAGNAFCVDPTMMVSLAMGNNGQGGALATGLPWYFAAVQIRNDIVILRIDLHDHIRRIVDRVPANWLMDRKDCRDYCNRHAYRWNKPPRAQPAAEPLEARRALPNSPDNVAREKRRKLPRRSLAQEIP